MPVSVSGRLSSGLLRAGHGMYSLCLLFLFSAETIDWSTNYWKQTILNHTKKGCCLETSQHPDCLPCRLTWTLLGSDPLSHILVICSLLHILTVNIIWTFVSVPSKVFLFLFFQIQYIQIYLHCPGVCGNIYLHFHVSKAGGKNWFTNHLFSLLAMGA